MITRRERIRYNLLGEGTPRSVPGASIGATGVSRLACLGLAGDCGGWGTPSTDTVGGTLEERGWITELREMFLLYSVSERGRKLTVNTAGREIRIRQRGCISGRECSSRMREKKYTRIGRGRGHIMEGWKRSSTYGKDEWQFN